MIRGTGLLIIELIVLFFGVSFLVQLSQRRVGPDRVRAWMDGRPLVVALKGIAVGFVTPFCTYSAIPVLVGFRQAGVSPAGYVAFIVAAPVLDPILFGALVLIVGIEAAAVYLFVAFSAALGLGLLAERSDIERHLKPLPAMLVAPSRLVATDGEPVEVGPPDGEVAGCGIQGGHVPWRGVGTEAPFAARAALDLLRTLAPLMLLGVGIGVAIATLVTPEMTVGVTSAAGPLSIPISAAMGTPLYFNTELFVPIADSLREAGIGTGPIVALTIAGAGANLPEFIILAKLAHRRLLTGFVAYVFTVAVVGGLLTQTVAG
jgi:hypothetical protein